MSHNRVPIVCLVLVALRASAFVATKFNTGHASQTDTLPLTMKILREKTHVKKSPGPSKIAAFKKTLPQEEERKLEDLIPKHVPIKIKIKKEKEAGFKDLWSPGVMSARRREYRRSRLFGLAIGSLYSHT